MILKLAIIARTLGMAATGSCAILLPILLARLVVAGLARKYWPVVCYFLVITVSIILSVWFPAHIAPILEVEEPIKVTLASVTLWRFSRQVFANYPPLRAFAEKWLRYLVPSCLIVALVGLILDTRWTSVWADEYQIIFALQRASDSALLVFVAVLGAFAAWFPVRMKRNVAQLLLGFLAWYMADWLSLWSISYLDQLEGFARLLKGSLFVGVTIYLTHVLGPEGEVEVVSPVPSWNPELLERRTLELARIQAHLSRQTTS